MTFIDCTPLCENFTRTVQKAMQMRSVWETEAAGFICRMVLSMLLMEPAVKKLVKAFASLNREWCILLKSLPGRRHVWKNVNGIIMAVTTVASHESWSSTGDFYNHCLLHIHGNILHCEETVVFFKISKANTSSFPNVRLWRQIQVDNSNKNANSDTMLSEHFMSVYLH